MNSLLETRGKKPRKGAVLICPECGTEFYVAPGQVEKRKYCSLECKATGQARQVRTTCVTCGKEFGQAQSIGGKYCSRKCYLQDRQPRKTCKTCGQSLAKSALTYCSPECMWRDRRTGTEKPCEVCGQMMYVEPHLTESKRFCSYDCANRAKEIDGPGARITRQDGYIAVYYPKHPDAAANGFILEHRLVAEQKYGRRILPTEHVHHVNGSRADNRPENLEVIAPGVHAGISNKQGARQRKAIRDELAEYRRRFGPLQ